MMLKHTQSASPGVRRAEFSSAKSDALVARLDLKFAGFRHSFTTRNVVDPPRRLQMSLVDGPFRSLDGVWDFIALGDAGCKVAFELDFDYAGSSAAAR